MIILIKNLAIFGSVLAVQATITALACFISICVTIFGYLQPVSDQINPLLAQIRDKPTLAGVIVVAFFVLAGLALGPGVKPGIRTDRG
jgi:hypothetical protein